VRGAHIGQLVRQVRQQVGGGEQQAVAQLGQRAHAAVHGRRGRAAHAGVGVDRVACARRRPGLSRRPRRAV